MLSRAVQEIKADKLDDAVIWLRKALQKNGDMPEAHYQLGRVYRKLDKPNLAYTELSLAINQNNRFKEAKKELIFFLADQHAWEEVLKRGDQYSKKEGKDPDILLLMGNALIALQRPEEAVTLLQGAGKEYPDNTPLKVTLARALLAADKGYASRQMMEKIAAEHPDDINIRLALESLYNQLGLHELSLQTLQKILTDFPDNPLSYRSLARFLFLDGKPEAAGAVLDQAFAAGVETPGLHQLRGMIAKTLHHDKAAEDHLKKAIALSSGKEKIKSSLLLAEYYIYQKRFVDAQDILQHLVKKADNIPIIRYRLVEVSMAMGKFDLAARQVDKLMTKFPDEAFSHILRGKLLLRDGKIKKARQEFAIANRLDPRSGESRFLYGLTFINESEKICMTEISKALAKNPNLIQAHRVLASLLARQGRLEKSLEEINIILSRSPKDTKARMFRIRVLLRRGKTDKALQDVAYLLERDPKNRRYRLLQAEIYSIAGNVKKAEKLYTIIRSEYPDDITILEKLVGLYLRAGRPDKALTVVNEYIKRFPEKIKPLLIKARIYIAEKKLDEAGSLLELAAEKDPENPVPLVMTGNLFRMKNDLQQAAADYDKALRLAPDDKATLMNLADVSMQLGRYKRAVTIYEKILKKDKSFLPALNNLLYLYTENVRNMEQGLAVAETLVKLNPKTPSTLDTLGWFFVQQGSPGRAEMYLEQALDQQPNSSIILYHLGMLRYQQKLWKKAAELLGKVLEKGELQADELNNAKVVLARINFISQQIHRGEELRAGGHHQEAAALLNRLFAKEGFTVDGAIVLATVMADMQKDLPKAIALVRQACDDACADDPRVADAVGWVYLQQGKLLLARQYLEQALAARPDNGLFRYHHGCFLYTNGKIKNAAKELTRAITLGIPPYDHREAVSILQKISQRKQ